MIHDVENAAVGFLIKEIWEPAAQYPPQPAGSRYVRTDNLLNSWNSYKRYEGQDFVVGLTNDATDPYGRQYAKYVYGPWQTSVHANTGWLAIEPHVRGLGPAFTGVIEAMLHKHLG